MPDYPPALSEGDEVAILAPSGSVADKPDAALESGRSRLESLGLKPVVYDTARRDGDYLRENPEARAGDVMRAFEDPDVKAVFAGTGGDDELRILRHLEPERLRANPTRFFGISDNTNLHCYLRNCGVVSFYGGQFVPGLSLDPELPAYTREYLRRALFDDSLGELQAADEWTQGYFDFESGDPRERHPNDGWTWHERDADSVRGRTWGGCLDVLAWQLATGRYLPAPEELEGAVLLLETSEEMPSEAEVRRFTMCMGERGLLSRFSAVLVGRPLTEHREPTSAAERRAYRENQREAILDGLAEYNPEAPVVFDLDFGHTDPHAPIPVGGEAVVDCEDRSISFPE